MARPVNSVVDEHRPGGVNVAVDWSRPWFYGWAVDLQTLVYENQERVATVTLNPSERGHALRPELRDELDPVLDPPGRPRGFVLARRLHREGLVT